MERYKEGPRGKPPHVFSVGHRAYYDMLSERKPQVRKSSRGEGGGGMRGGGEGGRAWGGEETRRKK